MAIGAAVMVAGAVAQAVIGANQAKKAKDALKDYNRQKLGNVAERIEISTRGAELQRTELARAAATSIQALQMAGTRGVVGGLGTTHKAVAVQSEKIAADLDRQEKERQKLIAQDDARIRDMIERREEQDLAGIGQQLATGQQNMMSGIQGAGSAMAGMGGMMGTGAQPGGMAGGMAGGGTQFMGNIGAGQSTQGMGYYV